MTLSSALNAALSGLTATGRATSLVSENIANSLTPGYAQRSLELSSQSYAAGVTISGVQRAVDPVVLASRRSADALLASSDMLSLFHNRYASAVGTPDDPYSIVSRLTAFEQTLIEATSRPDSQQRLDDVAQSAVDLASAISDASDDLQTMREEADASIATDVDRLNTLLTNIEDLNSKITALGSGGADVSALYDQRQQMVDEVNVIVPVNVVVRDHNQIALFTEGGAILLDGSAAEVGFSQTHTIVPQMTVEADLLSGLTINGIEVRTDSARNPLGGGTLGAAFEIRDELAVTAQSDLDAMARDLIERFQDSGVDATITAGDAGLFTDGGGAFDSADEVGIAARIAVNTLVDPAEDGETWRLRDGLYTATEGPSGEARQLQALSAALVVERTPGSGDFGTGTLTAAEISSALQSSVVSAALAADQTLSFAASSQFEVTQLELSLGVDTDTELGNLVVIEQAYAANARIIQVVDELMQTLLNI